MDVNDVIEQTLFLLKHHDRFKRHHGGAASSPRACRRCMADPERLIQSFMALMLNAMDAMNSRGVAHGALAAQPGRGSDELLVEFIDTGIGHQARKSCPRSSSRSSRPSPRAAAPGSGLSICYGIIADHRGRIEVESQVGVGSNFKVYLPRRMKLLVIEDDRTVGQYVKRGLAEAGYQVDLVADGAEGLQLASDGHYDVVVLDLRLPAMEGREVLRTLRDRGNAVPVLVLTAQDAVDFKVQALRMGADDYVTKPFALEELLARVEALGRRPKAIAPPALKVADLVLDTGSREVRRGGKAIELTPKEYAVLEYLMRHRGRVMPRTLITEYAWDYHFDPGTNIVDVVITRLRKKIDQGAGAEADPHGARRRLRREGVTWRRIRGRLTAWYATALALALAAFAVASVSLAPARVLPGARPAASRSEADLTGRDSRRSVARRRRSWSRATPQRPSDAGVRSCSRRSTRCRTS